MRTTLSGEDLRRVDAELSDTDSFLERTYPGERDGRQPVHTVYVPADRYNADLPAQWGAQALRAVAEHGGIETVCAEIGVPAALAAQIGPRVLAKLEREPIEDLRIDFEDGYGTRGDDAEDAEVERATGQLREAIEAGTATPFFGLRFKCLEAPTRRRGLRTLDGFLTALAHRGELPDGLVVTLPKVSTVSQVEAMVGVCERLETALGLPSGRIGFEIQVETPQLVLAADGTIPVARALHAGAGRVTSLHYGTYDYSASMGVAAEHQSMEHPVADQAKALMQLAVAGTGVHLSDGATNVLPVGEPGHVIDAWRLHHRLVSRSLAHGIYQGWDLHPAQLPTRYLATFGFYRGGFARAAQRLHAYVHKSGGGVLDEPATARALARYLHRGYTCGALDETELREATGLDPAGLALLARPKSDTESVLPLSGSTDE